MTGKALPEKCSNLITNLVTVAPQYPYLVCVQNKHLIITPLASKAPYFLGTYLEQGEIMALLWQRGWLIDVVYNTQAPPCVCCADYIDSRFLVHQYVAAYSLPVHNVYISDSYITTKFALFLRGQYLDPNGGNILCLEHLWWYVIHWIDLKKVKSLCLSN
jgi:hypothetical protein